MPRNTDNRMARVLIGALAFVASGIATAHGQGPLLLVPEAASYRYVNATLGTTIANVPSDWMSPTFDDSTWFVVQGSFGTSFGPDLPNASDPFAPITPQNQGATPWDQYYDPYVRTQFALPNALPLTFWIAVDNGVEALYLNGALLAGPLVNGGAAFRWEYVVTAPASAAVAGTNTVALRLRDDGVVAGFAMVVTGHLGIDSYGDGNVGVGAGGPFDVLFVNGIAGLPYRRVDVATFAPISITLSQPPTNPLPAPFAIYGFIGTPEMTEWVALPYNVGPMCFMPYTLNPTFPGGFLLANSFGNDPAALVPATVAPWSFTLGSGIPFPFLLTFQGVVAQDPATVRVTNGVIVNVQ